MPRRTLCKKRALIEPTAQTFAQTSSENFHAARSIRHHFPAMLVWVECCQHLFQGGLSLVLDEDSSWHHYHTNIRTIGDQKATGSRFFTYAASAFREATERMGLKLPAGQMTHVLRHTFASHFMMRGGNILALQKILGHANLVMTMRYAHLSPEHLQEAVQLNPLALLTLR